MISAATEPSREPEKVLPNRLPFFAKARKIRAAGLPDWLGLRLQIGR